MSQKEIVDLKLYMNADAETEKAILCYDGSTDISKNLITSDSIERLHEFWLAKSLVEFEPTGNRINDYVVEVVVSGPRWLLEQKGLL